MSAALRVQTGSDMLLPITFFSTANFTLSTLRLVIS